MKLLATWLIALATTCVGTVAYSDELTLPIAAPDLVMEE